MFVIPYQRIAVGEEDASGSVRSLVVPGCKNCERQLIVEIERETGFSDAETVACPVCGSYCINDGGEIAVVGSTITPRVKGWLELDEKQREVRAVVFGLRSETLVDALHRSLVTHDWPKSLVTVGIYSHGSSLKRATGWPKKETLSQLICSKLRAASLNAKSQNELENTFVTALGGEQYPPQEISRPLKIFSESAKRILQALQTPIKRSSGEDLKLRQPSCRRLTEWSQKAPGKNDSKDLGTLYVVTIGLGSRPTPARRQQKRGQRRKTKTVRI